MDAFNASNFGCIHVRTHFIYFNFHSVLVCLRMATNDVDATENARNLTGDGKPSDASSDEDLKAGHNKLADGKESVRTTGTCGVSKRQFSRKRNLC